MKASQGKVRDVAPGEVCVTVAHGKTGLKEKHGFHCL